MPYDTKKRPNYLGLEYERGSMDRLLGFKGVIHVADQNENKVENTTQIPTQGEKVTGVLKIVGLIVAALAGAVIAVASGGVAVPPWLMSIATAIAAIAAPLGIASSGLPAKK